MAQAKRREKDEPGAGSDVSAGEQNPGALVAEWSRPARLSTASRVALAAVVLIFNLPMIHYFVFRGVPEASALVPYSTDFSDTAVVERDFSSTGGLWRVINGELFSPGVKNNPLWLKAKLPQNVAVDFDVRAMTNEGDAKVEIFGDGSDHASGYVLIQGGWNNSLSIIARLDEHGQPFGALQAEAGRLQREKGLAEADLVKTGAYREDTRTRVEIVPSQPVQPGVSNHWRIERRNGTIIWFLNGHEYGRFQDPIPLKGEHHDRFGFSSWESQLLFDNLKIEAL